MWLGILSPLNSFGCNCTIWVMSLPSSCDADKLSFVFSLYIRIDEQYQEILKIAGVLVVQGNCTSHILESRVLRTVPKVKEIKLLCANRLQKCVVANCGPTSLTVSGMCKANVHLQRMQTCNFPYKSSVKLVKHFLQQKDLVFWYWQLVKLCELLIPVF